MFEALTRLNQIGSAINRLGPDDLTSVKAILKLIVENTLEVLPRSSALIYTYDEAAGGFIPASRVAAEFIQSITERYDRPRPDGMGVRAVTRRERVLSYEEPDLTIHPAMLEAGACSLACCPLIVAGEVLGVLYVYLHEERPFSQLELLLLDNISQLAAMTLSLVRQYTLAQQEQTRKEKELRRLRRAGMLISSRSSLQDTLDAILKMALEVTEAVYGIFRLVDHSGQHLVTQAYAGEQLTRPAVENLPIDQHSIMGYVALKREPVVISDLRQEPWRQIYYPLDRELEMRSEIALPLIGASGRLEGVVNLESPQVNAFSKQDRYILQILATHAVVAIQEVRLLDALQDIFARFSTHSLSQIHQALIERACDLLNIPTSLLWMVDGDKLMLQAAIDENLRGCRIELSGGNTGQVILSGQPLALLDASYDPQFDTPQLNGLNGKGSGLIVPVFAADEQKPIGAFSVYTATGDWRDLSQPDWDKKVLAILGHYAALAVQDASNLEALSIAQDQRATTETFAAIGDIAANLMHRLNNKIGTIPVRVEGIQDKCANALETDAYLSSNLTEIQRSSAEAMEIVRESLSHLRPIQLSPVSVAAAVHEAVHSSNLSEGVGVECEGLEELPPVQAGANRLALVFSNLIENANDAMRGNGLVQLRGEVSGKWVIVSVQDTGPGIPHELHERIFEFDYSARPNTHPGKLGFGLWWVKSLVARFGGRVSVESDGVHGTTFILHLLIAGEMP